VQEEGGVRERSVGERGRKTEARKELCVDDHPGESEQTAVGDKE